MTIITVHGPAMCCGTEICSTGEEKKQIAPVPGRVARYQPDHPERQDKVVADVAV